MDFGMIVLYDLCVNHNHILNPDRHVIGDIASLEESLGNCPSCNEGDLDLLLLGGGYGSNDVHQNAQEHIPTPRRNKGIPRKSRP